jgi:hypothetical protein
MIDLDATVIAAGMTAFGEMVTWTPMERRDAYSYPRPLAPQTVPAVFWDNAVDTKFQDNTEVNEITTYLSVRLSQMAGAPAQGDGFTVRGIVYVASEVLPDGVGGARVRIRIADDAQMGVIPLAPVPVAP